MKYRVILLCITFLVTPLFAQTITLTNGDIIEGTITVNGPEKIIIRTKSGIEEIDRRSVKKISGSKDAMSAGRGALLSGEPSEDDPPEPVRDPLRPAPRKENEQFTAVKVEEAGSRIESVLKFSADCTGVHSAAPDGGKRVSAASAAGFGISGETVGYLTDHLGAGFGISYQFPRSIAEDAGSFNFLPVYGIVKMRSTPDRGHSCVYGVGHFGYNFLFGDERYKGGGGILDGGLYYAAGMGSMIGRLNIELLYTVNNGSFRDSGFGGNPGYFSAANSSITCSKISLTAGINFQ